MDGQQQHGGNCVVNCTGGNNANVYSFHTGGAQTVMGDGSVRFLSENTDVTTVEQLIVKDDGQIIGPF